MRLPGIALHQRGMQVLVGAQRRGAGIGIAIDQRIGIGGDQAFDVVIAEAALLHIARARRRQQRVEQPAPARHITAAAPLRHGQRFRWTMRRQLTQLRIHARDQGFAARFFAHRLGHQPDDGADLVEILRRRHFHHLRAGFGQQRPQGMAR